MELLRTVVPGGSVETLKEELLRNGSWSGELKHQAKDGHIVTVESRLQLESMDGQRLVLESTRDVTERKVWEQRQHLLLRELTHRVKNTLAVVQSIANQTLRHTRSREDFVERFSARLAALAAAHGLLVHSDWKDADFEALARAQLDPYTPEHPGRLYLEGPQTGLPADLATPFGLVLHELAANAAKYGALSRDEGRVDLRWTIEPRGDERVFRLVWREVNGPPRKRGFKAGFGSMLIDKGVPGATVRREFTGDGFVCTIDLVLRKGRPPDTET
jgi:two-component system CheB/CheR fusion protein